MSGADLPRSTLPDAAGIIDFYESRGDEVRRSKSGGSMPCRAPNHPGNGDPNCSVKDGYNGSPVFYCHSHHCDSADILDGVLADMGINKTPRPKQEPPPTASTIQQVAPADLSEMTLAEAFVSARDEHRLRFVPEANCWYEDDGRVYAPNRKTRAYEVMQNLTRQYAQFGTSTSERKSIKSAKFRNGALSQAECCSLIQIDGSQFDSNPFELNTDECVIDLRTGNERLRTRQDYFTKITHWSPDHSESRLWNSFLDTFTCGDPELIECIQRIAGYCATADIREQLAFIFHGPGGAGKNVALEAICAALGNYHAVLNVEALMEHTHTRHEAELMPLKGARVALTTEPSSGHRLNDVRFKRLTGDKFTQARGMHQNPGEFPTTAKIVMLANYLPQFRGGDSAMARRMMVIPCDAAIPPNKRDKQLAQKLQGELPKILGWIIQGAEKWYSDGLLWPDRVKSATQTYSENMDDCQRWINECCIVDPGAETSLQDLLSDFNDWQETQRERVWKRGTFADYLEGKGFTRCRDGRNCAAFQGIRIKTHVERI